MSPIHQILLAQDIATFSIFEWTVFGIAAVLVPLAMILWYRRLPYVGLVMLIFSTIVFALLWPLLAMFSTMLLAFVVVSFAFRTTPES